MDGESGELTEREDVVGAGRQVRDRDEESEIERLR